MVSVAGAYDEEVAATEGNLQPKCAEPALLTLETYKHRSQIASAGAPQCLGNLHIRGEGIGN
jgi:hypothetical protein